MQANTKSNQRFLPNPTVPSNPMLHNFRFRKLPVRIVMIVGDPWFVAKDVCDVLELANVSLAVNGNPSRESSGGLDDDEKDVYSVNTLGGSQEMSIVSESGLYSLILRSRKTEAKLFKRWITHEVIPSIRKTGKYVEKSVVAQEAGGLTVWNVMQLALQEKAENEMLQNQVAVLAHKGEYYDRVVGSQSSFSLGETAKMLGYCRYGQNNLIKFLRYEGILMADNVAKQRYIDRGYFELVQREYATMDGSPHFRPVTRVLEKGIDFILRRIEARAKRLAAELPMVETMVETTGETTGETHTRTVVMNVVNRADGTRNRPDNKRRGPTPVRDRSPFSKENNIKPVATGEKEG